MNAPDPATMNTHLKMLSAAMITILLSACGGGGGSSADSGTTPPISQNCANGGTDFPTCTPPFQNSVPTPTYPTGSELLAAFNEVNSFRKNSGYPLLAQNALLDKAAQNHADCIVQTGNFAHTEATGTTCFTGVNPSDRAAFTGYSGASNVGELVAGTGGVIGVRSFMNSIYHREGLLIQRSAEIGLGFNQNGLKPLVIEVGYTNQKYQVLPSDFVAVYPANNQTGLPLVMAAESPVPFSDIDLMSSDYLTKTSSPISIHVQAGKVLTVSNVSVTDDVGAIPMRVVTASNDINKMLATHSAYFVGYSPFKSNTKYTVVFSGAVNGVPLNKTWSFTTGNSVNIGDGVKP